MKNEMTETRMTTNEGGELSELHEKILRIQEAQLRHKERELRFIATNVERLIEAMWLKAEDSREGYENRNAHDLWRGQSIHFDLRATNHQDKIYHIVEREVAENGGEA